MRKTIVRFSLVVLGFYLLFWGSQMLFPGGTSSTVILVLTTFAGFAFVQPGWNISPRRPVGYWAVLFGLLLGIEAPAVSVLRLSKIHTPYETTSLDIVTLLPGILAVTGTEALLFRQVLFRGLEQQRFPARGVVLLTSAALGGAHLGPLFVGEEVGGCLSLAKSLHGWIGLLLGELRLATNSWAMSWVGHSTYNVTVLFLFTGR
jgi:hypothetical protein